MHVDPPPIPLINSKNDTKSHKDFTTIKFRRDSMSENSDLYEFKMALFENDYLEEFLLSVRNFQMNLGTSGRLASGANIQYLHTLVCGEALHQLETLSAEVRINTTEYLDLIILGLGA